MAITAINGIGRRDSNLPTNNGTPSSVYRFYFQDTSSALVRVTGAGAAMAEHNVNVRGPLDGTCIRNFSNYITRAQPIAYQYTYAFNRFQRHPWTGRLRLHTNEGIVNTSSSAFMLAGLKQTMSYATLHCCELLRKPCTQMERETDQGLPVNESDQATTTIITRSAADVKSYPMAVGDLTEFASSEPFVSYEALTDRWLPLKQLTVSTVSAETIIERWNFPDILSLSLGRSIMNAPFNVYTYSKFDYEIKFVVNGMKFMCGKLIASVKYDPVGTSTMFEDITSMMARPHVILDLSTNNQGTLQVPFHFHRLMTSHDPGDEHCTASQVILMVLSPLSSAPGSESSVSVRPFVRLYNTKFTGPRASVQMDVATGVGLLALNGVAERILNQDKSVTNRDKPSELRYVSVIPRSRLGTCGKGPLDVIPLRMDPTSTTPYGLIQPRAGEPRSTLDIARVWGYQSGFDWNVRDAVDKALWSETVDPTNSKAGERLPPVSFVASHYMFWSGTLEYRFDFVSNAFHSGAVQISVTVDSNGVSTDDKTSIVNDDMDNSFTKVFQLSEQKSVSFTVPYIHDTPMRRSYQTVYTPVVDLKAGQKYSENIKKAQMTVAPAPRVSIHVRVVNQLRTVASNPDSIRVLVFVRGGEDFFLHGLKQSSAWHNNIIAPMHNMPTYVAPTPKTQMDQGEKEDLDTTSNFRSGSIARPIVTQDSQVDLKDIFRRPVLLFHRVPVPGRNFITDATTKFEWKGDQDVFITPVMPPSLSMVLTNSTSSFCPTVCRSPQAQLMSCFRFWRGSLRYTIVAHSPEALFSCTYLPHSGARLNGVINIPCVLDPEKETSIWQIFTADQPKFPRLAPICGAGFSTEMLVAKINPICTFETPYETENIWSLICDAEPNRQDSAIARADFNAGHLVIENQSTISSSVSIWVSVGDDFEVSNFVGIPTCTKFDGAMESRFVNPAMRRRRDVPHTQMDTEDFHDAEQEIPNSLFSSVRKHAIPGACAAASGFFPVVGSMATGYAAAKLIQTSGVAEQAIQNVSECASNVTSTITNLGGSLLDHSERLRGIMDAGASCVATLQSLATDTSNGVRTVFTTLKDIIKNAFAGIQMPGLEDFMDDLIVCSILNTWTPLASTFIKLFIRMTRHTLLELSSLLFPLINKIREWFENRPRVEMEDDDNSVLAGTLVGIIAMMMRVQLDPKKYQSRLTGCFTTFLDNSTISYLNGVINLFQKVYSTFRSMALDAMGMTDPSVGAMKFISENDEGIKQFVAEAQVLMMTANRDMLRHPHFKSRVWVARMQAHNIQRALCALPKNNVVPLALGKIVTDFIKFCDNSHVDMSTCQVRYEPFVYLIGGAPGIGKSYLNEQLVQHMMDVAGIHAPPQGHIYVRQPADKFYQNYTNQTNITFDDWCAVDTNEQLCTNTGDLLCLKSPAPFIVPQADIADKGRYANPVTVGLLTNSPYPAKLDNVVATKEAILRRRDYMVKAEVRAEFIGIPPRDLPREVSARMGHLQFRKYRNKLVDDGVSDVVMSWEEFRDDITQEFQAYHTVEVEHVQRRLKALYAACTGAPIDTIQIDDPFVMCYGSVLASPDFSVTREVGLLPSEMIQTHVQEFLQQYRTQSEETNEELLQVAQMGIVERMQYLQKIGVERAIAIYRAIRGDMPKVVEAPACNLIREKFIDCKALRKMTEIHPSNSFQGLCVHEQVLDNPCSVIYSKGKWHVTHSPTNSYHDLQEIPVGNGACCESCPFRDEARVAQFVDTHWEATKNLIFSYRRSIAADPASAITLNEEIAPVYHMPWTYEHISLKDRIWHCLHGMWEKYSHLLVWIPHLLMGFCTLKVLINGLSQLFSPNVQSLRFEHPVVRVNLKHRQLRSGKFQDAWDYGPTHAQYEATSEEGEVVVEAGIDRKIIEDRDPDEFPPEVDAIMRFVRRNTTVIYVSGPTSSKRLMVMGIIDKVALLPKHYVLYMQAQAKLGAKFEIEPAMYHDKGTNYLRRPYNFDEADFQVASDTDIAAFKVPSTIPAFKNLLKFFHTQEDLEHFRTTDAYLANVSARAPDQLIVRKLHINALIPNVTLADDGRDLVVNDAMEYDFQAPGACGSLVLAAKHPRPICAMHVGGCAWGGGRGYGVNIYKELFTNLIGPAPKVVEYESANTLEVGAEKSMVWEPEVQVEYLGVVPRNERPFIPGKSQIQPSLLHRVEIPPDVKLIPTTEPCILSPADPRYSHDMSPLYHGTAKHGALTHDFTSTQLDSAMEALWSGWVRPMKPAVLHPRRLTYAEAVAGIPDVPFYDALVLSTSAGYPWTLKASNTSKKPWIHPIVNNQQRIVDAQIEPRLLAELQRKEKLRREGVVPLTIFNDTLKDERKKPEKVRKKGGTRVFSISPVDYTIASRQNLLHFCAAFMTSRFDVMSAVGINAKSPEWSHMVRRLTSKGNNLIEVDYSNFGPAFNKGIAERAAEIIVRWTLENVEGVDETELRTLLTECTNACHLAGGTLYRTLCGSPSGASITTIINSLVNLLYIFVAWEALAGDEARKYQIDIWQAFREFVAVFVYGDDLIMSVDSRMINVFNFNTIQTYFAQYKIAATTTDKQNVGQEKPCKSITEATFLKRGFSPHPCRFGEWLSPLEFDAINDITQWIHDSKDHQADTLQNVRAAVLELHGHGIETFTRVKEQWNKALIRQRLTPLTITWSEIDKQWYAGELHFEATHDPDTKYTLRHTGKVNLHVQMDKKRHFDFKRT